VADHSVVAGNWNTDDTTVVAEPLAAIFSIIFVALQASDDYTGFDYYMSRQIF
jgi:hypothetical protein